MNYLASYLGHAPDDVRAAFLAAIEDRNRVRAFVDIGGDVFHPVAELCRSLMLCTDVLPRRHCAEWDLPSGSLVMEGAAKVLRRIGG